MKQVTWTQLLITLVCFGVIFLAHLAGPQQGLVVSLAMGLILWLREPPRGGPPPSMVMAGAIALIIGVFAGTAAASVLH